MKIFLFGILFLVGIIASASATEYASNAIVLNGVFGIGTFAAGEYDGGSVFIGSSISADWIPNGKIGLSYGLESGLLGGKKHDNIIFGIPAIFRFGWHPGFFKIEKIDLFILAKIGWGFGIWGSNLETDSTPGGIVCGINFGGSYVLTSKLSAYAEVGYNYYGLARNSNYPEYPLGYGSGKVYTSVGVSLKLLN
jgi:opacity protein-like surface antigen